MIARLKSRLGDEAGVALVMVIGVAMVLSMFVASAAAYGLGSLKQARSDQDWQAALAAANAGVDDYLSRINRDQTYWEFGNQAAAFSQAPSPAPTPVAPALKTPPVSEPNTAFFDWTEVPGSESRAQFRYDVNIASFLSDGVIKLQSTGRVGERTRTVTTDLRRRGFIDFLYFTDFDTKDPAAYNTSQDSYNVADAETNCRKHAYEGRRDRINGVSPGCTTIRFVTGDAIDGPLHSNDAFYVDGAPRYNGDTSTSYEGDPSTLFNSSGQTNGQRWLADTSNPSDAPVFARAGDPAYAAPLEMPPSNGALKREVDPAFTPTPGCLFTGPTEIRFNSNGTMTVKSPWTRNGGPAYCGTGSAYGTGWVTVPMPANGVIYVQDVPNPADAYTLSSPAASCKSNGNSIGYPVTDDITVYGCRDGDVFVRGTVNGKVTVAAENNVIVRNDLTYAGGLTGDDIAGLIANNYVETYHPVDKSGSNYYEITNDTYDLRIDAAILSVNHSFRVQNYDKGDGRGDLTVNGAIAQRFRGIVGTGSGYTGYLKDYRYDERLRFAAPPKFLDPVQSSYGVALWSEPRAAYAWDD